MLFRALGALFVLSACAERATLQQSPPPAVRPVALQTAAIPATIRRLCESNVVVPDGAQVFVGTWHRVGLSPTSGTQICTAVMVASVAFSNPPRQRAQYTWANSPFGRREGTTEAQSVTSIPGGGYTITLSSGHRVDLIPAGQNMRGRYYNPDGQQVAESTLSPL